MDEINKLHETMIVRPMQAIGLLLQSRNGDAEATSIMKAIAVTLKHIATSKKKALCMTCDHEFGRRETPGAVVITKGDMWQGDRRVTQAALAVCEKCADVSEEELKKKVLAFFIEQFPGSYEIKEGSISNEIGNA